MRTVSPGLPVLTIENGSLVIKTDGAADIPVETFDDYRRVAEKRNVMASSAVDFPNEHTQDPRVIALARAIRTEDPVRENADVLHVIREARKERRAGTLVPAGDLGLGDIVRLAHKAEDAAPYSSMTVVNKTKTSVKLVRPYVHVSDFTYTGGVISYTGQEELTVDRSSHLFLLQVNEERPNALQRHNALVQKLEAMRKPDTGSSDAWERGYNRALHEALELVRREG